MRDPRPLRLVLGAGGFIGTSLCRALLARGERVRGFGHAPLFPEALAGVEWIEGDFADRDALAPALRGCDTLFHLVSGTVPQLANQDPAADLLGNVVPVIALLQQAAAEGIRRVVFVSSGGTVYGAAERTPTPESAPTEPFGAYGVGKLTVEKYLGLYERLHGLEYRALRVTNPYGPYQTARKGQGVIAAAILRGLSGQPIEIWGDGSVVRDFVYIDDVNDALLAAAADDGPHRVYNIGSGVGRSLRDVLAAVEAELGRPLKRIWRPGRPVDVPVSVVEIARAREGLGWAPRVGFEEGLRRMIAWARTTDC
jgi:UDP-glucose 4-epimerase